MMIFFLFIRTINPADSIALLSDFDGTLAKINPNPLLTVIEPKSKQALEQLDTRLNMLLGIISGRPMYDVRKRVGIDNATYSGNHGMEIVFTNKTEFHYPITAEMYANCLKLKSILTTRVRKFYMRKKVQKQKKNVTQITRITQIKQNL